MQIEIRFKAVILMGIVTTFAMLTTTQKVNADIYPGYRNSHFSVNFPPAWDIFDALRGNVYFYSPDNSTAKITIAWDSPASSWLLDKGPWLTNLTRSGIIVTKIDNTTTVANHTALMISFTNNDKKYSVVLLKVDNMLFNFVYYAKIDDFPTHEDEANNMLNSWQIINPYPSFQDDISKYHSTDWMWWARP
jgi:hypothetical protein